MKAKEVALIGLFVALTAIGAQIRIPLGPVPFTMQVFFVILAGLILGARLGFISIALYDLLGALGLPVFAGMKGGLAVVIGPTGGYILAFPIASGIAGLGRGRLRVLTAYLGLAVIYFLGWAWLSRFLGPEKALKLGVLPFIAPDLAKVALALVVARRYERLKP
ncbi:biotin transporter BioY [Pyrococcus kukulkanii]|uniref:biotin transporter BioY n=1 Tax=Pyrococcus kukulkanii TaxID=1609559 RepID=UPI0035697242